MGSILEPMHVFSLNAPNPILDSCPVSALWLTDGLFWWTSEYLLIWATYVFLVEPSDVCRQRRWSGERLLSETLRLWYRRWARIISCSQRGRHGPRSRRRLRGPVHSVLGGQRSTLCWLKVQECEGHPPQPGEHAVWRRHGGPKPAASVLSGTCEWPGQTIVSTVSLLWQVRRKVKCCCFVSGKEIAKLLRSDSSDGFSKPIRFKVLSSSSFAVNITTSLQGTLESPSLKASQLGVLRGRLGGSGRVFLCLWCFCCLSKCLVIHSKTRSRLCDDWAADKAVCLHDAADI